MENLGSLLLFGGLAMVFIIIPAFIFLFCVKREKGKWRIRKNSVVLYLDKICYLRNNEKAESRIEFTPMLPKNMGELYDDILSAEFYCIELLGGIAIICCLLCVYSILMFILVMCMIQASSEIFSASFLLFIVILNAAIFLAIRSPGLSNPNFSKNSAGCS